MTYRRQTGASNSRCGGQTVPHMHWMFGQHASRRHRLQRLLASLLVLLMVSDLGFHLVDPFFHSAAGPSGIVFRAASLVFDPAGDCGIPGHEGTPFHHHHFPTLISQTASPPSLIALAWIAAIPAIEIVQTATIPATGRAPPIT